MELESYQLNELAEVACEAALAAGALIRSYTAGEVVVLRKEGGDSLASQVVTEVDERAQTVILERLAGTMDKYDLGLLTEELPDDGSRFAKDYFWCIDPLDGTLPFTQGKAGYAVSIALVRRDGQPTIGVVYDPVEARLFQAVAGHGLVINGESFATPQRESAKQTLRFCMDCTFETDPNRAELTERMHTLAKQLGYAQAQIEVRGGAVCNACYVLEHTDAIYRKEPKPELGGGSFWDFAATACIFQEAGAAVTDSSGRLLELNSATYTFFNHCGVCFTGDEQLAEAIARLRYHEPSSVGRLTTPRLSK